MKQCRLVTISFLAILCAAGCQQEAQPAPGIYYWQSGWTLTAAAADSIRAAGMTDLYLRLFDVDIDSESGKTYPRGSIRLPGKPLELGGLRVTPVIYIVNDVFRQITDFEQLVTDLLGGATRAANNQPNITEAPRLQIDCDWTAGTRDAYFAFLTALKRRRPDLELSVTVRLHQYRERTENGIPPADRGLLMCYNLAPVQLRRTEDAVFDLQLLAGYLRSAGSYPLPLDAALPLFSWGAAFRDDRFLGIVGMPAADDRLKRVGENRFLVQSDTTFGQVLLRAGDELRADGPSDYDELSSAIDVLRQSSDIEQLLFFDWRPDRLEDYRVTELITEFYH